MVLDSKSGLGQEPQTAAPGHAVGARMSRHPGRYEFDRGVWRQVGHSSASVLLVLETPMSVRGLKKDLTVISWHVLQRDYNSEWGLKF